MSFGNLSERYLLHYLTTGATTETTLAELSLINHAACPLLLRPNENLTDLEDLKATWAEAFPGDSRALTMLRHNLVRSHWELLRAQAACDEAAARYYVSPNPGTPSRLLEFFHRQSDRADRAFTRHLNTLRAWRKDALTLELTELRLQSARAAAAEAQSKAQSKVQPKAEPPKPVPAVSTTHPPHLLTLFQAVAVTVNPDASIRTELAPPNAELLATCAHLHALGRLTSHFVRRLFIFPAIVPDEYAWARVHLNADQKTPASKLKLNVYYTADEYIRLTDFEAAHNLQYPVQNPPSDFGDQTIVPCTFPPLQEDW